MNKKEQPAVDKSRELDALLSRGVQADQRASRPSIPVAPATTAAMATPRPTPVIPTPSPRQTRAPSRLERITVRFTAEEARMLEEARGVARAMGYKLSDTAVFRLALNLLKPQAMTAEQIERVLIADTRRRPQ